MLLKKLISSGALHTPYPLYVNGTRWKGSRIDFAPTCNSSCFEGKGKFYCPHGLAHFQQTIRGDSVVVCGYVDDWAKIPKEHRNLLANRNLKDEKVRDWFARLQKLSVAVGNERPDADVLAPLHDINRWASQVNSIAHRLLIKDRNLDFSKNFENASRDMKSLYKASSMLVEAFEYLNIFYNPSSAAFGKKRPIELYKVVDKIRIILMEAEGTAQNKKIFISGELRSTVDLYESFKIIPFCLLQNAIKYSFGSEITIYFHSNNREIEMAVESTGPGIHDYEKEKIFERGYRGQWSKTIHHEGLGVGLYIAKIVADAHNLEIKVRSVDQSYQRDGIPVFKNTFSIKMPTGNFMERRIVPR
jgi:anti-sigma regulatory factor (Ser/Thr protein kinase)